MTPQEKLRAIIECAVANGWVDGGWKHFQVVIGGVGFWDRDEFTDFVHAQSHSDGVLWTIEEMFFSHDFARAVFGEESMYLACCVHQEPYYDCVKNCPEVTPAWQHHLQQLVLIPDIVGRIEYVFQNMRKET